MVIAKRNLFHGKKEVRKDTKNMIQTKFILPVLTILLLSSTIYFALEDCKKSGIIITQKSTISLQQTQIDTLTRALKDKKENANVINIDIDKLKAKKNGQIILDATQLQALACDTVKIINWYNSLSKKEKRRF